MKLWAGRTGGDVDERLSAINNSIGFDSRMVKQDITGSIAHARMLGKVGVIDGEDAAKIVEGLKGILADLESGAPRASACTPPAAATTRWRWTSGCTWRTPSTGWSPWRRI